jgi:hypothetical protein
MTGRSSIPRERRGLFAAVTRFGSNMPEFALTPLVEGFGADDSRGEGTPPTKPARWIFLKCLGA